MLIAEIQKQNLVTLKKVQKIDSLMHQFSKEDLNTNVYEITDGYSFYTLISSLSTQKKAPLVEKFLCKKMNYQPVSASFNKGDAKDNNNNYYEFKTSFTNKDEKLNIRQIRPWQNIDFYYCFYINENDIDKSVFFVLTKDEMLKEIENVGSYTHGTKKANENNQNKEFSITIDVYNMKNITTKRWYDLYLDANLKEEILYR